MPSLANGVLSSGRNTGSLSRRFQCASNTSACVTIREDLCELFVCLLFFIFSSTSLKSRCQVPTSIG
eukprot:s5748_g2.t1